MTGTTQARGGQARRAGASNRAGVKYLSGNEKGIDMRIGKKPEENNSNERRTVRRQSAIPFRVPVKSCPASSPGPLPHTPRHAIRFSFIPVGQKPDRDSIGRTASDCGSAKHKCLRRPVIEAVRLACKMPHQEAHRQIVG